MEYFNIGLGLFLIGTGFLARKFPMLIAGYNTMSDEQRKKVDIDGLSSLLLKCLIVMGLLIAVGPYFLTYIGLSNISKYIIPFAILGVLPFLIINAQKYDHNTYGKFKRPLIIALNLVFVGCLVVGPITYGTYSPTIDVDNQTLTISGMYGISTQVRSIELKSALPKIVFRSNGFHFNETSKGNFKLEDGGTAKLFLQSNNGPFIFVTSIDDTPIYINRGTASETEQLFRKLKSDLN